jgi:hypothetical protein
VWIWKSAALASIQNKPPIFENDANTVRQQTDGNASIRKNETSEQVHLI